LLLLLLLKQIFIENINNHLFNFFFFLIYIFIINL